MQSVVFFKSTKGEHAVLHADSKVEETISRGQNDNAREEDIVALYIGIDCGTQGTKVIIYDSKKKHVVGEGNTPHRIISNDSGAREQDPQLWIDALDIALAQALSSFGGNRRLVRGIGVSGQQHGLVILDNERKVIRNAKLWNDTETALDNARLIQCAGGESAVISRIGTMIPVGYTASKLVWLRRCEPQSFNRIAHVMNPKDYINYYLSGIICTDFGSASGTGFFDVIDCVWNNEMVSLIDDSGILDRALPPLVEDIDPVGCVRPEIAEKFGLDPTCVVAAGSGDNMMAAVGTGNVQNGIATVTLGTSGVLSVFTGERPEGYPSMVQIQNTIPNGWIPTVCTMNATSTTAALQQLFEVDLKLFNSEMESAPVGSEGVMMLPFLNGERMPSLPQAKGVISGLTIGNISRRNLIRASAEAVIYGLRWGYDALQEKGIVLNQVRLVGGGSKSKPWRQIVADVLDVEVVGPQNKEAGAFGGIIQAMSVSGEGDVSTLCKDHIRVDEMKHAIPNRESVSEYEKYYRAYLAQRKSIFNL